MRYELLDGERLDLSELSVEDLRFLLDLSQRVLAREAYPSLRQRISGSGAYPLQGRKRVTREVHESTLYRVAEDLVDRAGIEQGLLAPEEGSPADPLAGFVSAADAAEQLGISVAAVKKAASTGRLHGRKIGNAWVLTRTSVDAYQVATQKVRAGRSAQKP